MDSGVSLTVLLSFICLRSLFLDTCRMLNKVPWSDRNCCSLRLRAIHDGRGDLYVAFRMVCMLWLALMDLWFCEYTLALVVCGTRALKRGYF